MYIFGNSSKEVEATNLQKEFEKLLPELQRLYHGDKFEIFIKRYFEITDEYKSMSLIMTEEGMNDYMLNLIIQGTKIIDNDLPNGAACILLGILGRAGRINNKVSTYVVKSIIKECEKIELQYKAILAEH